MKQLSDCTVLIVDDEQVNLDVLSKTLAPHFKTEIALDGPTAIEMVKANQPDLILLDIMMPEMDGHEVCTTLQKAPQTHEIPIIFVTAMCTDEEEARGFALVARSEESRVGKACRIKCRSGWSADP